MPRKKKITKPIDTKSSAPFTKVEATPETKEDEYINASLFSRDISNFLESRVEKVTKSKEEKIDELETQISNLEEAKEKYDKVIVAAQEQYFRRRLRKNNPNYSNEDRAQVASIFGVEIGDL